MNGSARGQLLTVAVSVCFLLLITTALVPSATIAGSDGQYKCVMFRDDDVTANSGFSTLKAVNQIQIDEGVPVTLGVIPLPSLASYIESNSSNPLAIVSNSSNPLAIVSNSSNPLAIVSNSSNPLAIVSNSSNPLAYEEGPIPFGVIPLASLANTNQGDAGITAFVAYLRSLASNNLFELAQHGYDHHDNHELYGGQVPSEFRGMPYDEQYAEIAEGKNLMQSAFGTAPTSFIPPYNIGDYNTLKALAALNFTVYSSCPEDVQPTMQDGQLRSETQSIALPDLRGNASAVLQLLINQTAPLLSNPNVQDIVVVYHYRYFSTGPFGDTVNSTKLGVLRDYIQYLKNNDVTFATLNGTHPATQTFASSSNAPSQVLAPLQAARTQWLWALLSVAAPAGVVIFLWNLQKQVK
jgi:peptidoglycan/xylan/chitin deacetylase (PgdA/CDA1 family)